MIFVIIIFCVAVFVANKYWIRYREREFYQDSLVADSELALAIYLIGRHWGMTDDQSRRPILDAMLQNKRFDLAVAFIGRLHHHRVQEAKQTNLPIETEKNK